jgi:ribosomal protein S6--L-glutamate ligase
MIYKKIGVIGIPDGWSTLKLADALEAKTGYRLIIDMREAVLDLEAKTVYYRGLNLMDLDAIVIKKIAEQYSPHCLDKLEMLRMPENGGVRFFSGPATIIKMLNRLNCSVSLRLAGIPMPETVVTQDLSQAFAAVEKFGRAVMKPLYSTKARGMAVIDSSDAEAEKQVTGFFLSGNPIAYIQKMLDIRERDLSVVFIGGVYLASYARVKRPGSWNTTIQDGGKYAAYEPDAEVMELANRAQAVFKLYFTCVDIVETTDGPLVFEVSAFGGFKGLQEACGIDAAGLYAAHILKEMDK